jgi:peptidoglycan-associated lipoprotein
MRKGFFFLSVIAFICSFMLVVSSCAKKQVKTEEAAVTRDAGPQAPSKAAADSEELRRAEAERQARLRETERQALLKNQMEAFTSENIYFDFDKADLRTEAQAILRKKAEWLKGNPQLFLRIEGHCDERGTSEYNLALGERRAQAAKRYLSDLGIPSDKIRTISYGEERPADKGQNEQAWSRNRRDEFKLSQ